MQIKLTFFVDLLTPVIISDYQPITNKEAADLAKLMSDCDFAVSNAELFMETLAKDLSVLDGVIARASLSRFYFCFAPNVAEVLNVHMNESKKKIYFF